MLNHQFALLHQVPVPWYWQKAQTLTNVQWRIQVGGGGCGLTPRQKKIITLFRGFL